MRLRHLAVTTLIAVVAALCPTVALAAPQAPQNPSQQQNTAQPYGKYKPAGCNAATPAKGMTSFARCYAEGLATSNGKLAQQQDEPLPTSLGPADIQSAYDLPGDGGGGRTVAIVDAYGYQSAESDLAIFRAHYGLPTCTTANGCFTKVDQNGGTNYPPDDPDWSIETALDLDAVSSACPDCKILLVEADNNSSPNLGKAVDMAASMGAVAISNSYGVAGEIPFESYYDHYYDHPGIAITASAGDYGNVQSYPATNPNVIAVGGTTLTRDSSARGWHESAWDSGGSGCSLYEPRPDYQQDIATGCPDTKATTDISADADPTSGLAIYNTLGQDGWAQYGGTSLASPLVAAMYAVAGTPVPGSYPVTYPYRQGARLNDVTDGSDGSCGNLLCNAGPAWDGPTGLGTPDGVSALTLGTYGYLAGTITDAKRHKALADATVTVTGSDGYTYHAVTDDSGSYRLAVAAGSFHVMASKFGYGNQTLDGVSVATGATNAMSFSLPVLPTRDLSGTVTDGSGQGWPVYAKITIAGYPNGAIYTDPFTGRYQVDLPTGTNYMLSVAPVDMPGYATATTQVAMPAGRTGVTSDVRLTVDPTTCTAAGYAYSYHGAGTGFEGWSGPQDGWQVTDDAGSGKTWVFNDPGGKGNLTGGSGQFAIVDDWVNPVGQDDTSLVSPDIDLTGQASPVIGFDTYYYNYFNDQKGDVYLSLDGGATWSDVWNAADSIVSGHVEIPIPQAAGDPDVKVKFRFSGSYNNYWELDNVFVGTRSCDPTAGGLVEGVVHDNNTGAPLGGATVSVGGATAAGATGVSQATTDDAHLSDGFYWLFSGQTGPVSLTASDGFYAPSQASVSVAQGQVVRQDWRLAAGHLTVRPASIAVDQAPGSTRSRTLRLTNDGTVPLHLNLVEQDRGFTPAGGEHQSAGPGTPLHRVKINASPKPFTTLGRSSSALPRRSTLPQQQAAAGTGTGTGTGWESTADYPTPIADNVVADNDGVVYSVAGVDDNTVTAAGYAYHPGSTSWTPIADLPQALEAPVGAFVDGKLYVAGGWDDSGNPVSTTYAYSPATNKWTRVADLPAPVAAGAATVSNGKLYVVAGCGTAACAPASTAVYRYDPDSNTWTQLADYPQDVVFLGCAGTSGGLVCAGGVQPLATYPYTQSSAATYEYVAGSNAWTRVADMPYTDWAMGYAGSGGKLEVVGGIVNEEVSNQAAEFDPATGTWSALPNAVNTLYRGGATCGIYQVGGSLDSLDGLLPTPYVEQLPGYDSCIQGSDVTWLSESSDSVEVQPGKSVTVPVTLDAPTASPAGEYDARLAITTDTPYQVTPVPITMTVR